MGKLLSSTIDPLCTLVSSTLLRARKHHSLLVFVVARPSSSLGIDTSPSRSLAIDGRRSRREKTSGHPTLVPREVPDSYP